MLKQEQVKTPELEKMLAVKDDSQKIGEFLEWCGEQEIILAKQADEYGEGVLFQISQTREQLLAEYFGIDLDKCEAERRELLDAVREDNKQ